jgi:hypothetical protein
LTNSQLKIGWIQMANYKFYSARYYGRPNGWSGEGSANTCSNERLPLISAESRCFLADRLALNPAGVTPVRQSGSF